MESHIKPKANRESRIENLRQRHQDDCLIYPDLMLNIGYGFVKAIFYIIVFSVSLIMFFSYLYLLVLVMYTIVGTLVTHYIAKPLIHMNYEQQRAEASYRADLSISNFGDCIRIMLGLAKKQKHLTYWQQFYGQVGVVVPLILIAPVYFTTPAFSIGLLMRFNSVSSTILDNTSFGITSFGQINRLLSCRKRLVEAGIICKKSVKIPHNLK